MLKNFVAFASMLAIVVGFNSSVSRADEEGVNPQFGSITQAILSVTGAVVTGTVDYEAKVDMAEEDAWVFMSGFTIAGTGISVEGAHTTLQPGETATWTLTDSTTGPESIGELNAILAVTPSLTYDPDPQGVNSWLTVDMQVIDPQN